MFAQPHLRMAACRTYFHSIGASNMKSIRNLLLATLLAAGAMLTAATGTSIAAADATHEWHHHGGPWHLLGKLGLDATQKQQIKDIMAAAMPQMKSLHEQM